MTTTFDLLTLWYDMVYKMIQYPQMNMQTCYLCQHPTHQLLKAKNRAIIRCDNCKLTYTPDSASSDGHIREDSGKFVKEYLDEARRYKQYFDTIIGIIQKHKKPQSLLDVGCGVGIFLQQVKINGWKAIGVDMSADSVAYARARGLAVRRGKIEELTFRPGSFDVITLFQTIEHIKDPIKTLEKLYLLLRRGGILVLTTPNEESVLAKAQGKFWFGYRNIEHLYFFNEQSLTVLQKKVGFKRISIHTENGRVLSAPWVLTRLFDYYYNQASILTSLMRKARPYWKYLNWITFREPRVNLVSVAVK